MALVGDCVVAVLSDPALGKAIRRPSVHQTVVEAHADDGSAVSFKLLKKKSLNQQSKCNFTLLTVFWSHAGPGKAFASPRKQNKLKLNHFALL